VVGYSRGMFAQREAAALRAAAAATARTAAEVCALFGHVTG